MGDPATVERGTADRATGNRLAAPLEPPKQVKPFNIHAIGLLGPAAIPDVLAYALEWELQLAAMRGKSPEHEKELAERLITLWHFLRDVETTSPRHPGDGALLVYDALQAFAQAKMKPIKFAKSATGESIPVTEWQNAPLPVWAPSRFPTHMTAAQIARYPKRPRQVDEIPPFFPDNVRLWIALRDFRPRRAAPVKAGTGSPARSPGKDKGHEYILLTDPKATRPDNEASLQAALDKAVKRAVEHLVRPSSVAIGSTPLISSAIATLSRVSLQDIAQQTNITVSPLLANVKLIESTRLILYHSVFSVVLDASGQPIEMKTRHDKSIWKDVPYAILVAKPGSQMKRHIPSPPGVYVSIQKSGDSQFRIYGNEIKKLLFGGVGGFDEYGYGSRREHYIHTTIRNYLDSFGSGFIAAVTANDIRNPQEITPRSLWEKIPQVATTALPFTIAEITTRLAARIPDFGGFLKEIGEQIVRDLIEQKIREMITNYLVKKIGTKIMPLINIASIVYDALDEEGRVRVRHAVACMILALKGRTADDMTIAAKVLAKIMADEFEEMIIKELVKLATKHGKKLFGRKKSAPQQGQGQPADKPTPPTADKENLAAPTRKADDKGTTDKSTTVANRYTGDSAATLTANKTTGATDTPPAAGGPPPRGTIQNPTKLPPGPPPPEKPIPVKEDDLPEGTDKIVPRPNQRTQRTSHEKALRADMDSKRGLSPLDHDAHHIVPKRGGGKLGKRLRDLLEQARVSVDDEANGIPARGLPRDPRAIRDSDSQHWNLHTKRNMQALVRELETVRGDRKATLDVLRKHGRRSFEDRKLEEEEFFLGPDDDFDDD